MRIFIFPLFPTFFSYETELEIILRHLLKKDEVFFLKCNSELKRCLLNPFRLKYACVCCKNRVKQGLNLIKFPKNNILNIPKNIPNYDFLPKYFNNFKEIMNYKYENYEFGRAVASNLLFCLNGNYNLDTIENREMINDHLNSAIFIYTYLLELFKKIKPDIVYVFNGRFNEPASVTFACKKLNITYFTHERASQFNRYLLSENTILHDTKYAIKQILDAWEKGSDEKYKIGEKWFLEKRYGLYKGTWRFTKFQKKNLLPNNFDKKKKIITIFNSSISEYYTIEEYDNPLYKDDNDAVRQIAIGLQNEPDILLYLRVHPNLSKRNNPQMQELREIEKTHKNLTIIAPESKISSYDLMIKSDIIITFGSTIGIEAIFWNKPCIIIGNADYKHLGSFYIPKSHEELIKMIKTNITPQSKEAALKYGYWQEIQGVPFKFFNQTSKTSGLFLGKRIYPTLLVRINSFFIRLFEAKNLLEILNIFKKINNYVMKTFINSNYQDLWL